jgi:hypothetical protein
VRRFGAVFGDPGEHAVSVRLILAMNEYRIRNKCLCVIGKSLAQEFSC